MLVLEGIPLFLVELGMGQKMRLGSLGVWNTIHPWLGGIGIASCVVTFFVALYYNVIITWCFYYLFNSLQVQPLRHVTARHFGCHVSREVCYGLILSAICTSVFSKLCKTCIQWHVEECSVAILCN
jgi:SNF family Na+-dependent transporter